jgi:hypothetical protein
MLSWFCFHFMHVFTRGFGFRLHPTFVFFPKWHDRPLFASPLLVFPPKCSVTFVFFFAPPKLWANFCFFTTYFSSYWPHISKISRAHLHPTAHRRLQIPALFRRANWRFAAVDLFVSCLDTERCMSLFCTPPCTSSLTLVFCICRYNSNSMNGRSWVGKKERTSKDNVCTSKFFWSVPYHRCQAFKLKAARAEYMQR